MSATKNYGILTESQFNLLEKASFKLFKNFPTAPIGNRYIKYPSGTFIDRPLAYEGKDFLEHLVGCTRYMIQDYIRIRVYYHVEKQGKKMVMRECSVHIPSNYEGTTESEIKTLLGMTKKEIHDELKKNIRFMDVLKISFK